MRKEFIDEMTSVLTTAREELVAALSISNESFKALTDTQDSIGDIIDEAAEVIDRKLLETLSAKDGTRLVQIDSALGRIRQGKYGLCVKCGTEIPEARLRALPYALLCVNCKTQDERQNR
jgi:RNA polymerase-binding protein DksA